MARPDGDRSQMTRRVLYAAGAISLLVLFAITQFEYQPADRPIGGLEDLHALRDRDDVNVLFILIDTLRADRLGSYGYERETSATLDVLAEGGVRFDHHLAQSSWTKASMASIVTGLYPSRTGVQRYMHAVPEEAVTAVEILSDAGFRTAGIWRNGWVAPNFGFAQGFEIYSRPSLRKSPRKLLREHPGTILGGSDSSLTEAAMEFLRTVGDERWFLYVHMMDLHQYVSDEESALFGTTYSDFYDNALHWTDRNIAVLLADLQRRDLLRRTIVVVASDHGEAFREHGQEGHARDLYGEVTETPLILSLPFHLESPIVVDSPSLNVDIWPTVLDLLGLPPLDDPDGVSLVPAIEAAARGETWRPDREGFAELDAFWGNPGKDATPTASLSADRYRAHLNREGGFELYDIEDDPDEQLDVAAERPDEARRLRTRIDEHLGESSPPWNVEEVELDAMMLNQLRALGYKIE